MGSTSTWLLPLSRLMSVVRPRRTGRGSREPDVPFQPTPRQAVKQMLLLGGVQRGDVLYDLGCGDGRIPITAAHLYGARGVGIDIDPMRIEVSRRSARKEGVLGRVTFRNEDLFEADISEATVVTLFLWPEVTRALRQKLLRDLRPGTRVVSYFWEIADWVPDRETAVDGRPIYLWTILPKRPVGARRPGEYRVGVGQDHLRGGRKADAEGAGEDRGRAGALAGSRMPRDKRI